MKEIYDSQRVLFEKYSLQKKRSVRDKLILENLKIVSYLLGRIYGALPSYINYKDLYSAGVLGLIKAIEKYDVSKNVSFFSYAKLFVRGAIIDELRKFDWTPQVIHKKRKRVEKAYEELTSILGKEPNDQEISNELNITVNALEQKLLDIHPLIILSPETTLLDNINSEEHSIAANVKDAVENIIKAEQSMIITNSVQELPVQEKTVLNLYYYKDLLTKDIAKTLHVSVSRVSQIHTKAIIKMRRKLKNIEII